MSLFSKLAVVALLATALGSEVMGRGAVPGKALYFLDNDPAGASIVALKISKDGLLSDQVRTPTGGLGQFAVNATGSPPASDTTHSQGIVQVSGTHLFTVSPGSNTLSMFNILPSDPTHPVLVETVSTQGHFPNSVAVSEALSLVCVVNTGGPQSSAGVSCFSFSKDSSDNNKLVPTGPLIPLPGVNQTSTPPTGPQDTTSDIVFNRRGTALFVSLKGDGTNPGFIYAFPVIKSPLVRPRYKYTISFKPVISHPAGLLLPFSVDFIRSQSFSSGSEDRAIITDPSFGAAIMSISYPSLAVTISHKTTIPKQVASCWSIDASMSTYKALFSIDGGNPNITVLDPVTGDIKQTLVGPPSATGHLDGLISGRYLYALQAAPGISVFDLGDDGILKASVDLKSLGGLGRKTNINQGWQGLAVYPTDI